LKLWYHEEIKKFHKEIKAVRMDKSLSYEVSQEKANLLRRAEEQLIEEYKTFLLGCTTFADHRVNLAYYPKKKTWYCADGLHERTGEHIEARDQGREFKY